MFRDIFGRRSKEYQEGQRLFEDGMAHASRFESDRAIELYTNSIAIHPNPAPYINRANLLSKRMRNFEALTDLLEAKRLDAAQSREFGAVIDREIATELLITSNYRSEIRAKLLEDLASDKINTIARKIFSTSFKVSREGYWQNSRAILEYHFFNDLDNIVKFEDISRFPEAEEYLELYGQNYIDHKIIKCPDESAYLAADITARSFLCCYPVEEYRYLRRRILWDLHQNMLHEDYGDIWSFSSEAKDTIKDFDNFNQATW
ncbi:tetratricopeptide repeat protein [Caulobacter hibisci]|uniref:Tetratricopeptide repeat protein n=1 Tax=Caulobacter hibisci TaxID=2035993 RepID=A0ABS0T3B9_9CAUL|nr:hypothetical protein [Caulobacter hibisci]MBI1685393.1 hypothetical protein [Caulobacter hibisci]